jgi:hypothetical protein
MVMDYELQQISGLALADKVSLKPFSCHQLAKQLLATAIYTS